MAAWDQRSGWPAGSALLPSCSGEDSSPAGEPAALRMTQTTEPTPSSSPRSEREARPSPSRSRSCWRRAPWVAWGLSLFSVRPGRALTLLVLLTLASAPGCCSEPLAPQPVLAPGPVLPVGEPPDRSPQIQEALDRATVDEAGWTLPHETVELILSDRLEWKAWAEALKASGRWRE